MATPEEIRQRVEQADVTRSARRAAAAQQVGDLAGHRAAIVAQLTDVERELGEALADAQDVIDVDELARFTDLKASDLTGWLAGYKPSRGKRRKPTPTTGAQGVSPSPSRSTAPVPKPQHNPGDSSVPAGMDKAAGTDTSGPLVARVS